MCIMAIYTATCTRLVHTNSLVLLGWVYLLLVVSVRMVPLGFTRLITLITSMTLVPFPLFIFFDLWGLVFLLRKHLTMRGVAAAGAEDAWMLQH